MRARGYERMPLEAVSDNRVYHSRVPVVCAERDAGDGVAGAVLAGRSRPDPAPGDRVRHPIYGEGTILQVLHPDPRNPRTLLIRFVRPCVTGGRTNHEIRLVETVVTVTRKGDNSQ